MKYFSLILLFAFLLACTKKKEYGQEVCEDLSMKSYRGLPKESKEYKNNCLGVKNQYPYSHCQKALEALMLVGEAQYLESEYGVKIMNCFNKADLHRFLKKSSPSKD